MQVFLSLKLCAPKSQRTCLSYFVDSNVKRRDTLFSICLNVEDTFMNFRSSADTFDIWKRFSRLFQLSLESISFELPKGSILQICRNPRRGKQIVHSLANRSNRTNFESWLYAAANTGNANEQTFAWIGQSFQLTFDNVLRAFLEGWSSFRAFQQLFATSASRFPPRSLPPSFRFRLCRYFVRRYAQNVVLALDDSGRARARL